MDSLICNLRSHTTWWQSNSGKGRRKLFRLSVFQSINWKLVKLLKPGVESITATPHSSGRMLPPLWAKQSVQSLLRWREVRWLRFWLSNTMSKHVLHAQVCLFRNYERPLRMMRPHVSLAVRSTSSVLLQLPQKIPVFIAQCPSPPRFHHALD